MHGYDRGMVGEIAQVNPRLAYWLLAADAQTPQVYSIRYVFASGAADTPGQAYLDQSISDDFWVHELIYQVRRPNAFAGSMWKAEIDVAYALNPYVDVTLNIQGGYARCEWMLNGVRTPIENIARPASSGQASSKLAWPFGWVMTFTQTVRGDFLLARALGPDEGTLEVILSFHGLRLGCQNWGGVTIEQARRWLHDNEGIRTPDRNVPVPGMPMGMQPERKP